MAGALALLAAQATAAWADPPAPATNRPPRLFWFVPDGMRADPELFDIYRWAVEGRLPNIRKMMERGTYGYAKPVFPSHTPANFASLFTGAYPERHGVNDGPMHTEGNPLAQISVGGFSSAAKLVEPIWVTLEKAGPGQIVLLSVPGSTPPELSRGWTIRGRWGRWGADFHAMLFQDRDLAPARPLDPGAARLFYQGSWLTRQVPKRPASGWRAPLRSCSPPWEAELEAWGATLHAAICDRTDNQKTDYDAISFSNDKQTILCSLGAGQWSDWLPITLQWRIPGQTLEMKIPTALKIKVVRLEPSGLFRVRFLYNELNKFLTDPDYLAAEIVQGAGPMTDFVDNFPPQLVCFPEDKQTFLEEADLSLRWHRDAAAFILEKYQPQIFIHDTYTPNQMLTSRWWMGYVDPQSARYGEVTAAERETLWQEIRELYRKLDDIVGVLLNQAGSDTVVVLSSDHGAVPLNAKVRLNNLLAREGLLQFSAKPGTGERIIDWARSQAIYLQMHNIYLNPAGLAGNWRRASGPDYARLRQRVKNLLLNLEDKSGVKPVEKIVEWERVAPEFRLHPERAGDLVVANRPGYGWSEELTEDLEVFSVPLETGYKQALIPGAVKGLWTPFIILGPGIKKGHFLGDRPIEMIDEHPTILRCLGVKLPDWVQGEVVRDCFSDTP